MEDSPSTPLRLRSQRPPEALFLDRDGTLIEHVPYLHDPAGVVLLPGVREALLRAKEASIRLFLVTNQSGVGRGWFTLADVEAVNGRMLDLLGLGSNLFTAICIAPERPDEPSAYRKPSPRFIQETLALHGIDRDAAWMLGDSAVDWEAGRNAGIHVAAIVPEPRVTKDSEMRARLGVPAYASVLEWLEGVPLGRLAD
jgi:D-glycero-D-manno-heptose 1,7-bisphosphate phosphatase